MIEKEQLVETAITIWEATEKRSHETIYKTDTTNKRLRATTLAIAKLEKQ